MGSPEVDSVHVSYADLHREQPDQTVGSHFISLVGLAPLVWEFAERAEGVQIPAVVTAARIVGGAAISALGLAHFGESIRRVRESRLQLAQQESYEQNYEPAVVG